MVDARVEMWKDSYREGNEDIKKKITIQLTIEKQNKNNNI